MQYAEIITANEVISNALALAGDAHFDNTRFVLGDWSLYSKSTLVEEDVRTLIAVMKSVCNICPFVKNAVVIRPDKSGNALVAFYKMLAEELPWEIEIFHTLEEAFDWFGLPMTKYLCLLEQTSDTHRLTGPFNTPIIP